MYDISILIPSIRTNRWAALLESLEQACKNYRWEVVFIGPFADESSLLKYGPKAKWIKELGSPTRAIQRGFLYCNAPRVFLTVDDCTFLKDSIDNNFYQYSTECEYSDVLNMRYKESNDILDADYYLAGKHDALRIHGINPKWKIAPQFIIHKDRFVELGGYDCTYEYNNEANHELMFRLQADGGHVFHSNVHCCIATHYPGTSGDHGPIHHATLSHDYPIFRRKYELGNVPIHINYDNWRAAPEVWQRRFSQGIANTYEELIQQEGYKF